MCGSCKIYVTGDGGEDLFTRSEEGSRPIQHSPTHSAADTSYDIVVPRGAPFIKKVLDALRPCDWEVNCSWTTNPTGQHSEEPGGPEPLLCMLTHLKQFDTSGQNATSQVFRVSHIDRLITPYQVKHKPVGFGKLTRSPDDLLIIHDGGGAWSEEEPKDWFKEFLKKPGANGAEDAALAQSFPRVLVNVKALPKLWPSEPGNPVRFRSPFWDALYRSHWRDVGIVVAMSTLRRNGAAISRGLSWEQTIEDFAAELNLFPELNALGQFRDLFVRVGVSGLIHIENDGSADCPYRGRIYFSPNTLEGIHRDPEVDGRVIGKNTVLIASLAYQQWARGADREAALQAGICNAIVWISKFHDEGYCRKVLDELVDSHRAGPASPPSGEDSDVGTRLINESITNIKEAVFPSSGGIDREYRVRLCEIPQYLLGQPLPTKLRIGKRWRMLDDALHDAPVNRVNIAMSIVKGGHSKILNKRLTREAFSADRRSENGQQIWRLLNRNEYWNPHDRAPDYVTLEDGDHPSPPVLPRQGLPEIGIDVLNGIELNVPVLQFGNLTVAEREEIEGLCSVSRLLQNYIREKEHNRKPISIAVFGPPGTGKSFAIKQIAKTIDPGEKSTKILEFNVAQFKEVKDLGVVLNNVGSVNHRGVTPLVFFDEFDCVLDSQPLGWLKYFLAPMQDGNFYDAHHTIDIGRAIFVFAGGTYPSFERFDPRSILPNEELGLEISEEHKERVKLFAERKGPDFISRLRGHINVSQINTDPGRVKHFIRRALILRSLIVEQGYTHPKNDKDGTAMVDEEVVYALLTVDRYRHGVRSMEAIVQMCTPLDGYIHIASLPSRAQLNMHVDAEEFFTRLYRGRSRKYPENDIDEIESQLKGLANQDSGQVVRDVAIRLCKDLVRGANPLGVSQKLQILKDIANLEGVREPRSPPALTAPSRLSPAEAGR